MTAQRKMQSVHAGMLGLTVWTLLFNFNLPLLIAGVILGWSLWFLGVSVSLHKWFAHSCFKIKHKPVEYVLLYLGTICCLESHISWRVGHKLHHKYSGQVHDPFTGHGFWGTLKVSLYHHVFPDNMEVDLRLRKIPHVVWFHRNYFKIITATFLLILLASGSNVGYFTAIPVCYVMAGYIWITSIAHCRWSGKVNYEIGDNSTDNLLWQFIFPGEGNHNTHHKRPWEFNNGFCDFTVPIIDRIKAC